LIVHWPKGIAAKGELRRDPGHLVDILPTILDSAGGKPFTSWQGRPVPAAPGKSLLPSFASEPAVPREPIWWLHEGNRALRVGVWKIVSTKNAEWELYDLENDRAESKNLSKSQPDRLRSMAAEWTRRAEEFQKLAARDLPAAPKRKNAPSTNR